MTNLLDVPIDPLPSLLAQGWEEINRGSVVGLLFRRNAPGHTRLVITFDALSAYNHRREKVSGQDLVARCGADHLHFSYTEHCWYQTEEIFPALDNARGVAADYCEVTCLGHSMGAYAALIFSRILQADRVIAFAPQISPDANKLPFENRFTSYMNGVKYVFDDMDNSISPTAQKFIVFDPHFAIDRQHFDGLAYHPNVQAIRLPFSGHFPAYFLKECGILGSVTTALIDGTYDERKFRKIIRYARGTSFRYMLEAALAVSQKKRFRLAVNLANRAYALNPQSPHILEAFQVILQSDALMCGLTHMLIRLLQSDHPSFTHYDLKKEELWNQILRRTEFRLKPNQ